jgi:hypothetical protein|tara:strand:+ start:311 stop:1168 length:858 start_codon:yes stop_codon:yes gene_type:complete
MTIKENGDSIAEILKENQTEEIQNDIVEGKEVEQEPVNNEDEKPEEAEEIEEENPEKELEFLRLTSGWTKEEKELVKKINDPDLKQEAIDATRKRRVDFDRRSLELGNTKKELAELRVKMDELLSNKNKIVDTDNDDDYLTDQELKQQKQLEDVKRQLEEIKQEKTFNESQSVQKEVNDFREATDEDGILKFPYFDRVRQNMSLLFQADPSNNLTLEKAYKRAILLDEELAEESMKETILRDKIHKQKTLEKVKKNKRFSPNSKEGRTKLSPKDANAKSIAELFG